MRYRKFIFAKTENLPSLLNFCSQCPLHEIEKIVCLACKASISPAIGGTAKTTILEVGFLRFSISCG